MDFKRCDKLKHPDEKRYFSFVIEDIEAGMFAVKKSRKKNKLNYQFIPIFGFLMYNTYSSQTGSLLFSYMQCIG